MAEPFERASTNQLLLEILTELKRMNSAERTASSVKVTLQRGTVDIAVHAYDEDIEDKRQEAVRAYRQTLADLNQDGADAFGKTLEALRGRSS